MLANTFSIHFRPHSKIDESIFGLDTGSIYLWRKKIILPFSHFRPLFKVYESKFGSSDRFVIDMKKRESLSNPSISQLVCMFVPQYLDAGGIPLAPQGSAGRLPPGPGSECSGAHWG